MERNPSQRAVAFLEAPYIDWLVNGQGFNNDRLHYVTSRSFLTQDVMIHSIRLSQSYIALVAKINFRL